MFSMLLCMLPPPELNRVCFRLHSFVYASASARHHAVIEARQISFLATLWQGNLFALLVLPPPFQYRCICVYAYSSARHHLVVVKQVREISSLDIVWKGNIYALLLWPSSFQYRCICVYVYASAERHVVVVVSKGNKFPCLHMCQTVLLFDTLHLQPPSTLGCLLDYLDSTNASFHICHPHSWAPCSTLHTMVQLVVVLSQKKVQVGKSYNGCLNYCIAACLHQILLSIVVPFPFLTWDTIVLFDT